LARNGDQERNSLLFGNLMNTTLTRLIASTERHTRDLGLLGLRLWLAYEFGFAGWTKLQNLHAPEWFGSLTFPAPLSALSANFNWISAGVMEASLSLLLLLGIYSRLASLGLLFVTYVAVYTVHFDLGWAGWNQIETEQGLGFKVPLMLALMLLTILTQGPGRWAWPLGSPSASQN
jgi:putative oxidoreductase